MVSNTALDMILFGLIKKPIRPLVAPLALRQLGVLIIASTGVK